MKKAFAALVVAASAIFAPVPVAHSNTAGVIPEAKASGVIQEAKAVDVKVAATRGDFGSFNAGLPMNAGFDRERETTSWWKPKSAAPSVAWMVALGFLGMIILRRTRNSPM
jgi:hypothetical protein